MKPKHQGGYSAAHAHWCRRVLVTLLRKLGPWRDSLILVGGLVPQLLIPPTSDEPPPLHAGTTDVDLVVDLVLLSDVEAYNTLEKNLKNMGMVRGQNEDGRVQHFTWRRPVAPGVTVVVDFLCDIPDGHPGRPASLPGQKSLSALHMPGVHLAIDDYVPVPLTEELLDEGGVSTEMVRVANIVPFIVLKTLAFEDRDEEKDAYDLIYCLQYFRQGPADVAQAFADTLRKLPSEPLLGKALAVLHRRFVGDGSTPAFKLNGPARYAGFLTDPGQPERTIQYKHEAVAVVDIFLSALAALREN